MEIQRPHQNLTEISQKFSGRALESHGIHRPPGARAQKRSCRRKTASGAMVPTKGIHASPHAPTCRPCVAHAVMDGLPNYLDGLPN